MSELVLIRHGQASFGAADYDYLSPLGECQASLVGRALAGEQPPLDVVMAGELRRQFASAEIACSTWDKPPDLIRDSAFNEYDSDAIFAAYLPRVLDANPDLADRYDELWDNPRLFQKVFEKVMFHWIGGTPDDTGACEPWVDFKARVHAALDRLHAEFDKNSRIAIFTSGGPIAVAVAASVEASDRKTLEINWGVHNASVTSLRSRRSGWRLAGFNNVSALRATGDTSLITYR